MFRFSAHPHGHCHSQGTHSRQSLQGLRSACTFPKNNLQTGRFCPFRRSIPLVFFFVKPCLLYQVCELVAYQVHAAVKRTKDNRELVAFTVVTNHRYKTKSGEKKEEATFFSCAYWLSTAIVWVLKKGMIVSVSGRVGINSYKNRDGDFIATSLST